MFNFFIIYVIFFFFFILQSNSWLLFKHLNYVHVSYYVLIKVYAYFFEVGTIKFLIIKTIAYLYLKHYSKNECIDVSLMSNQYSSKVTDTSTYEIQIVLIIQMLNIFKKKLLYIFNFCTYL